MSRVKPIELCGLTGSRGVVVLNSGAKGVRRVEPLAFDNVEATVLGGSARRDFRIDLGGIGAIKASKTMQESRDEGRGIRVTPQISVQRQKTPNLSSPTEDPTVVFPRCVVEQKKSESYAKQETHVNDPLIE